ncbi:MAG: D-alanyl-D-alanine carboxypeptidase [Acidobacteriota bacterium]
MTGGLAGLSLWAALLLTSAAPGDGSRLGCHAARGERVLASQRADELFVPASTHKLAVAAAALHHLGPEYRVTTRLWAGSAVGPELDTLILEAAADPTWSERFFDGGAAEPLALLARQVHDAGVRRVRRLVVDLSRFPGRPHPSSRAVGDLAFAFAAPTAGLAIDDNAISLRMAPGDRVGAPARFEALGGAEGGLEIRNLTTTAPASRNERGTVDFQAEWSSGSWTIRGEYPIGEPAYTIALGAADGELRAARALARALAAAGVAGSPLP